MKVLIIGSGDIGTSVGKELHNKGHHVVALRRSLVESNDELSYIQTDISDAKSIQNLDTNYDYVLFIAAVDSRTQEAYESLYERGLGNVLNLFTQKNTQASFIFISSTVVYGQSSAEYVDEETQPILNNFRAEILFKAEQKILSHNELSVVIRFSGIYRRGDNYMIEKIKNHQPVQHTPSYYTNRIHRDDCIGVIVFLMQEKKLNLVSHRLFNATQGEAISLYDYALMIAEKNNLPEPDKEILDSQHAIQGKRISNDRLLSLGYKFQYTSFFCINN